MALRPLPLPCPRKGMAVPGRSRGRVRTGQIVYLSEERVTCKTTVNLKEVGGRS